MSTDLNETQNDEFDQKKSTYDNILDFFNNYISAYVPYKDEPTYKAVISFFIKYYIDIIYNQQLDIFKQLFEQQTIPTEVVDLLLVSIGLPEKLIKNITTTSKFVILKSFSDFERYKGTIKFIRSIGGAFSDVISYYELFIDYDENYVNPVGKYLIIIDRTNITNSSYFTISSPKQKYLIWFNEDDNGIEPHLNEYYNIEIKYSSLSTSAEITREIITALNNTENKDFYVNVNGTDIIELYQSQHGEVLENPTAGTTKLAIKVLQTGKKNGSWILRPRPIYIHPKMSTITEPFSYLDAYNKIPTLLVPVEQLDQLRERNEIILPTKSNIILMDYTSTIDGEYFTIFKY